MASGASGEQWVAIAEVVRSRGNRGEVEAVPLSNLPERFRPDMEVYLFGGTASVNRATAIEAAWEHRGRLVLKFRGIDSIDEAERLRGSEVRIPLSSRSPLAPGEYYQSDLIGFEVVERGTGRRCGCLRGWREFGGPALLEIEAEDGGDFLVPFASSICVGIDLQARRIVVDLPEGLKDLNRR